MSHDGMIEEQPNAFVAVATADAAAPGGFLPHVISPYPVIKIRPGIDGSGFSLKEVWAHRELLYFLIWRDLKVRYKQTVLGAAWVILQPLLMALIFTVFMSRLARIPSDGVPYPLFAYAGLLPWMFFSNSISTSSAGLIANSYMITKVYFPRMIIPIALVGVRLLDFITAAAMLLVMMFFYQIQVGWNLLLLPLLLVLTTLLTLGLSIWFSAINIKYRDVGTLLPLLLQVLMFASPVIYPASLVPEKWRVVYALNPMAGLLEGFRSALFNLPVDWTSIGLAAIVILSLFAYFLRAFCRMEETMVDII